MNRLSVNIDHVATVRQARKTDEPDPVWAAVEAELGGADGITFHLREDRRHINDRDAELLRRTVAGPVNLEMGATPELVQIALRLKPHTVTLVPERREEMTTEGGLAVPELAKSLRPVVAELDRAGIHVTAFIEPHADVVKASADCGFASVELWTGAYAHARPGPARSAEIDRLIEAVEIGMDLGMPVRGGHGLTYRNVSELARLGCFEEFNIGHSIVSRAVLVGMRAAVREMKRLLDGAKLDIAITQQHDGCGHEHSAEDQGGE
jgi:pyridoxine 5-phosphate synthase